MSEALTCHVIASATTEALTPMNLPVLLILGAALCHAAAATPLYVPLPFCAAKCHYCDFVSYPNMQSDIDDYIDNGSVSFHCASDTHNYALTADYHGLCAASSAAHLENFEEHCDGVGVDRTRVSVLTRSAAFLNAIVPGAVPLSR